MTRSTVCDEGLVLPFCATTTRRRVEASSWGTMLRNLTLFEIAATLGTSQNIKKSKGKGIKKKFHTRIGAEIMIAE